MSGGVPSTGIDSLGESIKTPNPKDSAELVLSPEERARRKRAAMGPATPQPPDLADMALKDAASGKVRRIRAGSMRDSLLSSWGGFLVLVGVVGLAWVRAVLRGDVW